jgi:fumarate reductase (CoM/CoB) subunit A
MSIMLVNELRKFTADVLVVGGGGAGLRAAIAAAEGGARVLLAVKGLAARSGATPMAGNAVQAVFDPADSMETAVEDMQRVGRYLGDENLIQALVTDAPERVRDLVRYGVKFEFDTEERFSMLINPGQTHPRNVTMPGNGYSLAYGLRRQAERTESIHLLEDCIVTRLFTTKGCMAGALAYDMRAGAPVLIEARAVVLATGGYQELWRWTDAETGLTGDGAWLAFKAGATLVDLEMMQHYPTVVCHPPELAGVALSYEYLLDPHICGGQLLDRHGKPLLAPGQVPVRGELSKIIFTAAQEGRAAAHGGMMIDLSPSPLPRETIQAAIEDHEPGIYRHLHALGIDLLEQPVEVHPFTHYVMGGVWINEWGETGVTGLLVGGEAGGNLNGADRISGNGLAESQVFGARAGQRAAEFASGSARRQPDKTAVQVEIERLEGLMHRGADQAQGGTVRGIELKRRIKALMDAHVNGLRDEAGLKTAIGALQRLQNEAVPFLGASPGPPLFNLDLQEALEAEMMVDLAQWVAAAAMERRETRGGHNRLDFPNSAEKVRHTVVSPDGAGGYQVTRASVVRLDRRAKAPGRRA